MGRKQTGFDEDTLTTIGKHFAALVDYAKEKEGLTASDVYKQIYDDDEISNKEDKISKMKRGDSITAYDVMKIQAWKNISLDWLILGKGNPPQELQKETATTEKAETKNDTSLPPDKDTLIKSLLDIKLPVLQTCAVLINLFKYANISIVKDKDSGIDYDINNFDTPQTLTVKISPKCFSIDGKYIPEEDKFYRYDQYMHFFSSNLTETFKSLETIVCWDIRATYIQRLLAIACQSKESDNFNSQTLLNSVFERMNKRRYVGYYEYEQPNNPHLGKVIYPFILLSSFSIDVKNNLTNESASFIKGILPLNPSSAERRENFKKATQESIPASQKPFTLNRDAFLFHDLLSCTRNCRYNEIPENIKNTVVNYEP